MYICVLSLKKNSGVKVVKNCMECAYLKLFPQTETSTFLHGSPNQFLSNTVPYSFPMHAKNL